MSIPANEAVRDESRDVGPGRRIPRQTSPYDDEPHISGHCEEASPSQLLSRSGLDRQLFWRYQRIVQVRSLPSGTAPAPSILMWIAALRNEARKINHNGPVAEWEGRQNRGDSAMVGRVSETRGRHRARALRPIVPDEQTASCP